MHGTTNVKFRRFYEASLVMFLIKTLSLLSWGRGRKTHKLTPSTSLVYFAMFPSRYLTLLYIKMSVIITLWYPSLMTSTVGWFTYQEAWGWCNFSHPLHTCDYVHVVFCLTRIISEINFRLISQCVLFWTSFISADMQPPWTNTSSDLIQSMTLFSIYYACLGAAVFVASFIQVKLR